MSTYYHHLMDASNRLRKYEPDKIALLVFFALGLLIAFLISSSRYSGPARAGSRLIGRIKYNGISSLLDIEAYRTFFEYEVNSASMLYMPGRGGQEKLSYFRCDQRFDRFSWKSETVRTGGSIGVELSLDEGQNRSKPEHPKIGIQRCPKKL
ncbi:MAG: hypothetical protein ACYSWP_11285 [Planctomycetota bacterium]